jgi:hypothetical protein
MKKLLEKIILAGALALAGCSMESPPAKDYPDYHKGQAPVWQTLSSQRIPRASSQGTIIYENILEKCSDPDDPTGKYPLQFYIMNSWNPDYEVQFEGDDLVITALNPNYTGARDIILRASDNYDPTGFHQSDVSFTLVVDPAYSRDETHRNLSQDEGGIIRSWWNNDYSSASMEQTLLRMHDMGLESVTFMTTYYQQDKDSTTIEPNSQRTPAEAGLEKVVKRAKELGFKTVLKPHVDLYDNDWRGHISFSNESDWLDWFESYKAYIVHMAEFAENNGVDMFIVGTELEGTSQRTEWYDVISDVRAIYSGELTYSANWDNYHNVIFWDALDYAGISEYYPIASNFNPTSSELEAASELRAQEIDDFAASINKPVILTEIAFPDCDGAGMRPNQPISGVEDMYEQADCYNARLKTLINRPSIAGITVYGFYYDSNINPDGFTVTGNLAEDVISYWYHYTND